MITEEKNNGEHEAGLCAVSALRSTDGVAEALRAVINLIDDGVLVRNIENDHDTSLYIKQAMKLTCVLQNAQVALASATAAGEPLPPTASTDDKKNV